MSAHINHVPGLLNDLADKPSRSSDPVSLGFSSDQLRSPPRAALSSLPVIRVYPPDLNIRSLFGALS